MVNGDTTISTDEQPRKKRRTKEKIYFRAPDVAEINVVHPVYTNEDTMSTNTRNTMAIGKFFICAFHSKFLISYELIPATRLTNV